MYMYMHTRVEGASDSKERERKEECRGGLTDDSIDRLIDAIPTKAKGTSRLD